MNMSVYIVFHFFQTVIIENIQTEAPLCLVLEDIVQVQWNSPRKKSQTFFLTLRQGVKKTKYKK